MGGSGPIKIRLVDAENNQVGIVSKEEAMSKAQEAGLDLVEVAPNSEPPVCRIMDYGKWLYQQKRRVRDAHKKTAASRGDAQGDPASAGDRQARPGDQGRHARAFLEKGHRVQFSVFFRGRQMLHKEQGYEMLNEIMDDSAGRGQDRAAFRDDRAAHDPAARSRSSQPSAGQAGRGTISGRRRGAGEAFFVS